MLDGVRPLDYLAAMRSFVRSAELGSFSRAAEEAGVKVSTVSRSIAALEADVGAALFNRSTHGLHLTEIGRMFHEQSGRILANVEEARALASAFNAIPQGKLKITIPATFGRLHVVTHLPAFLAAYPAITVEATLTDAHVDMIEAGVDLAIRIGALPDSGLIARRLARHERVLCASPAYLAACDPIATPADVGNREALVSLLQPGAFWHFRQRGTGATATIKVSGRVRLNDSEALLTCALAGQGLAVLPTWLAHADLARGSLVALLPEWDAGLMPVFERGIWVVYPPKRIVSPKVRAFTTFFESRFRKPVYWEVARPA